MDAGRAPEALRAAESLAKANPSEALVAEMLGRARIAARCPASEIADAYAAAARLAPDSPGLQGVAGLTASQAGRVDQALEHLGQAERLEPGNPQHAMLQARLLLGQARPAEALAAAERARAVANMDTTVLLCTARCRVATGDLAGAAQLTRMAKASAAPTAELLVEAAELLAEAGASTEAMTTLEPCLRRTDTSTAVLEQAARCQSRAGRPLDAAATWQRLASSPAQPWRPCLIAAECLLEAGDSGEARAWLSRAADRGAPPEEVARVEARLAATPLSGSSDRRPEAPAPRS